MNGGGGQRFLYEVRPDIFPQGFLTELEINLWCRYYEFIQDNMKKNGRC